MFVLFVVFVAPSSVLNQQLQSDTTTLNSADLANFASYVQTAITSSVAAVTAADPATTPTQMSATASDPVTDMSAASNILEEAAAAANIQEGAAEDLANNNGNLTELKPVEQDGIDSSFKPAVYLSSQPI